MARAGGGPPPFSYDDIPNQLLRINSLEGSLAFSGGTLTGVTDVSGAGQTVTVTGSPTYTATDAGLNGAPSFGDTGAGGSIIAPNVNRANMTFVAAVVKHGVVSSKYIWDADDASGRSYGLLTTQFATHRGSLAASTAAGRKRVLAPFDGTTQTLYNGSNIGTLTANNASGSGVRIGNFNGGGTFAVVSIAFFMACSSVPSAPLLAALEAKLITDFG